MSNEADVKVDTNDTTKINVNKSTLEVPDLIVLETCVDWSRVSLCDGNEVSGWRMPSGLQIPRAPAGKKWVVRTCVRLEAEEAPKKSYVSKPPGPDPPLAEQACPRDTSSSV